MRRRANPSQYSRFLLLAAPARGPAGAGSGIPRREPTALSSPSSSVRSQPNLPLLRSPRRHLACGRHRAPSRPYPTRDIHLLFKSLATEPSVPLLPPPVLPPPLVCPRDPTPPRVPRCLRPLRAFGHPAACTVHTCGSTAQEQEGFASMSGELQVHASIVGFLAWLGGELSLDAPNGMLGEARVRARSLA